MSARMKWVNHPRWGWLPDAAMAFECVDVDGPADDALRECVGLWDEPLPEYADVKWSLAVRCVSSGSDFYYFSSRRHYYRPLTAAARELLAALRAEVAR